MKIRTATRYDLPSIMEIGNLCFPPEEAVTEKEFEERLKVYPNHVWMLEEDGEWQTIFGVNTAPKYRKLGYATKMMEQVIVDAKKQGRKGCMLTCKEKLIHYYEKFGYENKGISKFEIAGEV